MLRAAKSVARNVMNSWISAAEGEAYVRRFELARRIRPRLAITLSHDQELFLACDGAETIAIARKSRIPYYLKGSAARQQQLAEEYLIPSGFFREGDVVIDCGANIGDFSIMSATRGAHVFAFEPDRREFAALVRNSKGRSIRPFQIALWNQSCEMEWFDENDTGDSSLFASKDGVSSYTVTARPLDDIPELPDGSVRLVKLEAEGAEPEILAGMRRTLSRTEFVSVDMGPERGAENKNTVPECTAFLWDAGFKMKEFYPKRCTGFFERRT